MMREDGAEGIFPVIEMIEFWSMRKAQWAEVKLLLERLVAASDRGDPADVLDLTIALEERAPARLGSLETAPADERPQPPPADVRQLVIDLRRSIGASTGETS
ncbi:CATRA system-associated protein [Jidongwangia harbinensis]|uniref:CATRA system-associated protein n=1 Tax=Jidongwangia harbinensis TaxID=2878561 RepID=UPI001CD96644|nr:CATRA system-associated protein [Jidongwangia harbinensis]MCA2211646.1 hypothetical protein [Jidongwangia harbinensis]